MSLSARTCISGVSSGIRLLQLWQRLQMPGQVQSQKNRKFLASCIRGKKQGGYLGFVSNPGKKDTEKTVAKSLKSIGNLKAYLFCLI